MQLAIVEDNNVTRETLKLLLSGDPRISAVEAYATAEEALERLAQFPPEVLLVDLDLPGMHGTELIRQVKQAHPEVDIMVHTIFEDRSTVFAAIKAGASGYILKGSPPQELMESLQNLYRGGAPMSPKIARKVILEFQSAPEGEDNPLSPRESAIVRCIEQGLTYQEIADRHCISPHTVHTHIKKIYEKLQANGRRDALRRARKFGII
jgi:two-component system NarL family response regulator